MSGWSKANDMDRTQSSSGVRAKLSFHIHFFMLHNVDTMFSWQSKLDAFFMCDRIKDEQYKEWMSMLEGE